MSAASSTPVIPGYQISSQLYAGSRTRVYRAIREQETLAVVIKLLTSRYPSFNELLQFRNQYTISKNLNIPGIIRPLSLEVYGNSYILVMEDGGEISLREYIKTTTLSLGEFLVIAIQLTNILHDLHQNRVIHKDIKPTNIVIHPQTKQVKLIDFSIASLLPKETQEIKSPNILEGTLAYISPEQTGRMNRGIDYRSDFYSLGVTFYELLTGELPFISNDPMELVHCHIAKMPTPLGNRKETPRVLADIVMKLMAKNAEDRYQSALGLRSDLENCLYQLKETARIESFEIAQRDVCDRFLIREKLYGREIEVTTLLQAFERVANGSTEMMLVAGFSGVGKTAVVNEVHKPITRQQGYFIKGKFDQFNRNIPLSAFVQAFRDLMAQLLSESDTQLTVWQTKILAAVGENGQVIVEVIPELERIIGKQPPVPELSGSAAQNRFNLLFQKFIQVFTTKEHPLVMFLDDLQWADSASLNLLQLLMNEASSGYLLILGAYRDNEVFPAHPLMLTLEQIQKAQAIFNTITLLPLGEITVNQLVADTLSCSPELAQPLTQLVYQKTKGNPFFTTQFLKALHEDGWIQFQSELGYWQCDMVAVRQLALTDDVVEFMGLQLQKLPVETQAVLKLAACIGNCFDLSTLAIVCERSESDVADALWKGLQEGFVLPQSEIYKFYLGQAPEDRNLDLDIKKTVLTYKFLHDRVQQAAYSLIANDQQQATHLAIGRLLLQNTPQAELDSNNIFDIVNHWNKAIDLIVTPLDRQQLVSLNLMAGQKAKTSAAYEAALKYFTIGINLLAPDCWQTQYNLALQLYTAGAEVSLLSGNYQQMEALITAVLNQTKELLDQVKVYKVKIQARIVQNQQQDCLDIGLSVLQLLGVPLESNLPTQVKAIEELIHLPKMKDPHKLAAADILIDVITPAWTLNPELFQQTVFTLVNLSINFGNCPASAFGYAWYGTLLCETLGDTDSGYQFGQLALKLLDKFNAKELRASVNVLFATHIGHWKDHTRTTLPFHLEGVQHGLETGNLEYAGYGAAEYCQYLFLVGEPLDVVEEKCRRYLELIQKLQLKFHLLYLAPWQQGILNLQGSASNKITELVGDCYDERHHLQQIVNDNQLTLGFVNFFVKALLCYLFADYERAIEYSNIALQNKAGVFGTYFIPTSYFYASLAILANYANVKSVQQEQYRQQIIKNLSILQNCAIGAPTNYRHKYELVEAEYCRVLEQKHQAMELYDRAIASAKENGYIQEEALSNELAAKFYLNWGKQKVAAEYMQQAYYCYTHWGAKAKVSHLEQQYPQLLTPILQPSKFASEATIAQTVSKTMTSSSSDQNLWLDLPAVMKAAQAISQEIELEKLLATLMQIAIANAGAQIGHLVLHQEEKLLVVTKADCQQVETLEIPLEQYEEILQSLIYAVARTQQTAVFEDLSDAVQFAGDRYIITHQPKSVLCTPISRQGKLIGILYLENNLTVGAFTSDRIEILQLLTSQAAISVENARLYQQTENYAQILEAEVERKTQALNHKAEDLERTLKQLQQTQAQLIHSEKMSSLGQIVAGIAHEINNPVNFIKGNLSHTANYIQDMMRLLTLYQQECPQPSPAIQAFTEDIDLDFLFEDANQILESMKAGSERISQIVLSLRNFSRLDEAEIKAVDLHSGIESTLLILQHRLPASGNQPEVRVIKEYGKIPLVTCYPSQLNQVFLNIINNAIDAIRDNPQCSENPEIRIRTEVIDGQQLLIAIANTDSTIPVSLQDRIFEPFFTTKPVGRGQGLGLFVSYSIIQQHGGSLTVRSQPMEGTEFEILLPMH